MKNTKIRLAMTETETRQWEVAKMLGVSESVLSRKLREELPEEEQNQIVDMIRQKGDEEDA